MKSAISFTKENFVEKNWYEIKRKFDYAKKKKELYVQIGEFKLQKIKQFLNLIYESWKKCECV